LGVHVFGFLVIGFSQKSFCARRYLEVQRYGDDVLARLQSVPPRGAVAAVGASLEADAVDAPGAVYRVPTLDALDAFCDEGGKKSGDMPSMQWNNEFRDEDGKTKVVVTITFANEADMNKIIEMGFEQGFSMALENLDMLLAS
jgi:uncharacterized protein YndB with AHSA1/START domain